jgi:serine/threonine-protein kinase
MIPASRGHEATVLGRYVVFEEIAAGGMATVHLGRLRGAAGFARMVAVKRLHHPKVLEGGAIAGFALPF